MKKKFRGLVVPASPGTDDLVKYINAKGGDERYTLAALVLLSIAGRIDLPADDVLDLLIDVSDLFEGYKPPAGSKLLMSVLKSGG